MTAAIALAPDAPEPLHLAQHRQPLEFRTVMTVPASAPQFIFARDMGASTFCSTHSPCSGPASGGRLRRSNASCTYK